MARRNDDSDFIKEYNIKEHKFMTMEVEKRQRVIYAALKEFSKGYMEANTDVIVKDAGVSKGIIFHYFGSKRGLFLFLVKYSLDIVTTEYERVISKRNDFLENIRLVSKAKADMSRRYPLEFGFTVRAYSSIKEVFPEGLPGDMLNLTSMGMQQIHQGSNNDKSLFKEGIDSEKAKNIIIWTMNGFTDSLFRYGDDVDAYKTHYYELEKEFEEYLQTLRKILYR